VDKVNGKTIGSREATLAPDGTAFASVESLGKQLSEDLCKLSDVYAVTLDAGGEGRFATHSAAGRMQATLRARRDDPSRNVWRATGPLAWSGVSFTSKIDCPYIDLLIPTVSWSVTILDAGKGELAVTWRPEGNDMPTASVDCPPDGPDSDDPPPIPGQPGPSLVSTGPETFYVPYAGGQQVISGGFEDNGDGWFNTGTVTVTPSGVS
jgi:hypothetical protein